MECRLIIGSTNIVELARLRDRLAAAGAVGEYPTTATVTLGLVDALGTPVTGATTIALTLVSGTSGQTAKYRGTIPHTVTLTEQTYIGTVTVTVSGLQRVFTINCPAVKA